MKYHLRRKHWISSAIILFFSVPAAISQSHGSFISLKNTATLNQPTFYTINHFVDGDTISVNINGKSETVRFIGIDTPETHKPNTPVQCYGVAAATYTQNRIKATGNRVRLVADKLSNNRDRYNRLLRYVYLTDGTDLDQELVTKGYAFAYTAFPFTQSVFFKTEQATAQKQALGLWGNCHPYEESDGRWQTNTVT